MIIKASRISTRSGPSKLVRHVFYRPDNEDIRVLARSEFDVSDAFLDAKRFAYSNAVRHVKISPAAVELDDDQAIQAVRAYAVEFRGDPESVIVIKHEKARANDLAARTHFHAIIPEFNHTTGKVMDSSWMFPRHEKLARQFEVDFRDTPVIGRFAIAVKRRLTQDGNPLADVIELPAELPKSAFTSDKHQSVKRTGHDLARMKAAVKKAWNLNLPFDEFQLALAEAGVRAVKGEKTWIIETNDMGDFIGTLERFVGVKRADVFSYFEKYHLYHHNDSLESAVDTHESSENSKDLRDNSKNNEEKRQKSAIQVPNNGQNLPENAENLDSSQKIDNLNKNDDISDEYPYIQNDAVTAIFVQSENKESVMHNKELIGRINKLYSDLDIIRQSLKNTRSADRASRKIFILEELISSFESNIKDYVDYVLQLDRRKNIELENAYNSKKKLLDAHISIEPPKLFKLLKRYNGWEKVKIRYQSECELALQKFNKHTEYLKMRNEACKEDLRLIHIRFIGIINRTKVIINGAKRRFNLFEEAPQAVPNVPRGSVELDQSYNPKPGFG